MTATLTTPPTTRPETKVPVTHLSQQTFTVGTLTISAVDEAEALRKYKRMVRAEALKAKHDMQWCDSGTNDRLRILGVRKVGEGVPMRVTVTATRIAYLTVDAEDQVEAEQIVAEGGPDVLELATATIGRGSWEVTAIAGKGLLIDPTKVRAIGDVDDTLSGAMHSDVSGVAKCDTCHYGWYCTMPAGHGGEHVAGDGLTVCHVWDDSAF